MAKSKNGFPGVAKPKRSGSKKKKSAEAGVKARPVPVSEMFGCPTPFGLPPEFIEKSMTALTEVFKVLDEDPIIEHCVPWVLGGFATGAFVGLLSYAKKYDIAKAIGILEGEIKAAKRGQTGTPVTGHKKLSKEAFKERIATLERIRDIIILRTARGVPATAPTTGAPTGQIDAEFEPPFAPPPPHTTKGRRKSTKKTKASASSEPVTH